MNTTFAYVLATAMVVVGVAFLLLLLRGNERWKPQGLVQWAGVVLSVLLLGFAGLLATLAWQIDAGPGGTASADVGDPAPDFTFVNIDTGDEVALSSFEGNVVVVNFWATWCAPCLNELPALNDLQADFGEQGLTVLTISDEHPETIRYFERDEIALETVSGYIRDPETLPDPFSGMLSGRPMTYIVDREGVLRQIILGERTYDYFASAIAPYLRDDLALR